MSNKNEKKTRRPYNLKARARRQEEVHKRITLATVELHEKVGPAKTTIREVAKIAGVRRATVYNHFPTEYDLIDACSSHWFSENTPPDSSKWLEIDGFEKRTIRILEDMYDYFQKGQKMLNNVLKDRFQVEAMNQIYQEKWVPMIDSIAQIIIKDMKVESENNIKATVLIALDFFTWETLNNSGLSIKQAAKLVSSWIISSTKIGN